MKVLLADDDRISRHALGTFLFKWGYEVVQAGDGTQAWDVLQREDSPRLALLDWMMPGMDGPHLCRETRKRSGQPYVYILLLTAKGQKQDILEGLEAGADDYIVKPFDAQELHARLRVGERILDLESQLLAASEQLRFQASHDSLTGLYNRPAILDVLRRELARSRREGAPVGVVLLDLDHFKQVNDLRGHLAGDAVLRESSKRMIGAVRVYDSVGRYGGEEFLLVLPNSNGPGAVGQAERIRAAIQSQPAETPEGPVPVTASLGVVSTELLAGADSDCVLRAVDAALYRAKRAGRNRVEAATVSDYAGDVAGEPLPALKRP